MSRRTLAGITLFVLCTVVIGPAGRPAYSESTTDAEHRIKAAFIYNFSIYIDWPAASFKNQNDSFVLGVVGSEEFADVLAETLVGKTARGHAFTVKHLQSVRNAKDCHIVFLSGEQAGEIPALMSSVQGAPVLTVGESQAFADAGGMISFLVDSRKLRFEVNSKAARESGLVISSRLLSLARRVQ